MAKERKKMSTLHKRNWLNVGHKSLFLAKYSAPVVPAVVTTAINWEDWFVKSNSGFHVSMGFIFTIISVLLTYFSIAKKKKLIEKVSAFWSVAIIVICWAIAFIFLSLVFHDIGMILLYIGFSLLGSATFDEFDTHLVIPAWEENKSLVSEYGLDKREVRRKEKKEERIKQAKLEAELESRKQAID